MQDSLQPGLVLRDRYRLECAIGSGAFGEVWRAERLEDGFVVAIKFLRLSEDWARRRFDVEAQALSRLKHPHCVRMHDFGVVDGIGPFIVTDFLAGETLRTWMPQRSAADLIEIAAQIADGVAEAHRCQIVHRDLKPDNVFIAEPVSGVAHAVVIDFGLARLVGSRPSDVTKTGEVLGTPEYASPEQLRGLPDVDGASDVYALGVMLFEMLCGSRPFDGDSRLAVAMKHLTDAAPELPVGSASGDARALVAEMLRKDRGARPAAREVAERLRGRQLRPVRARGAPGPAPDRTTPRPAALIAVIALVAAAVVALAIVVTVVSKPEVVPSPSARPAPRIVSDATGSRPAKSASAAVAPPAAVVAVDTGSTGCGQEVKPGLSVMNGSAERVLVRVPKSYDPGRAAPVLMVLHDLSQTAAEMMEVDDLMALAERDGFVVLAHSAGEPVEIPILRDLPFNRWTDPRHVPNLQEDLFLVSDRLCLDLDRVFVLGHGNGGTAAEYFACKTDGVVALATSTHRWWGTEKLCDDAVVPTIFISALNDPGTPVSGNDDCFGKDSVWSLAEHEGALRERHGCGKARGAKSTPLDGTCYRPTCSTELELCHVEGGRDWASMPERAAMTGDKAFKVPTFCPSVPSRFDYARTIWDFFTRMDSQRESAPPAAPPEAP